MFKVGDRVKVLGNKLNNCGGGVGKICNILSSGPYSGSWDVDCLGDGKAHCYVDPNDLELIGVKQIKTTTTMSIKEKFALVFKSEPEKSFRKAGITNGDDLLTEDGKAIFLSFLLKKYGAEFKKDVVDEMLDEEEEKA